MKGGASITNTDDIARQIADVTDRLAALDREQLVIADELDALERKRAEQVTEPPAQSYAPVTIASLTAKKIALFRSLFQGRKDVFPRRWENVKTGKAGYAPACRNEWVRSVCGKPHVKCGECPNQAFFPVGDDVICAHLTGQIADKPVDFTAGVYPLLPDETCWFLAADFDKAPWLEDAARNDLIFDDILSALENGRSPVVITERNDHLDLLAQRLSTLSAKTGATPQVRGYFRGDFMPRAVIIVRPSQLGQLTPYRILPPTNMRARPGGI